MNTDTNAIDTRGIDTNAIDSRQSVPLILTNGVNPVLNSKQVENRSSWKKSPLPPTVSTKVASDLLESLWCKDAFGVMLARVQVLGTEVQFLLTQLTC